MAGIDEVPTEWFFCHCFSSCVAALFAQKTMKSRVKISEMKRIVEVGYMGLLKLYSFLCFTLKSWSVGNHIVCI